MKKLLFINEVLAVVLVLMAGCSNKVSQVEQIPLEDFFKNPEKLS
jgi:hypothetical protein